MVFLQNLPDLASLLNLPPSPFLQRQAPGPNHAQTHTPSYFSFLIQLFREKGLHLHPGAAIGTEGNVGVLMGFFFTSTKICGGAPPDSLAGSFPIIFNCVLAHELTCSPNFYLERGITVPRISSINEPPDLNFSLKVGLKKTFCSVFSPQGKMMGAALDFLQGKCVIKKTVIHESCRPKFLPN